MSSLKDIRTRIASVKSTRQITSAMKMVSAAKLKKAQDSVINLRPYAHKLNDILNNITQSVNLAEDNIYSRAGYPDRILLVVISSNKGLCGAFNANVIKETLRLLEEEYAGENQEGKVDILTIGKAATDHFTKKGYKVIGSDNELLDQLCFDQAVPLIEKIIESFTDKTYDRVMLVYNRFKNAAVQILTSQQFLPVEINYCEDEDTFVNFDYIMEPDQEYIVKNLIPKSLKLNFYEALLESLAAEHGARMTAMHKATDNATTLIKELQLTYNKARQATITNEISEIVGGAEALSK
ncbi:MAG: ATP synthase F1 subunit gamma [Bacteroidales bacterium]|jgi:F-type H+-transporting ATPase subunit gamma|nr:ATP synthase F1 subunit gamma [Bacteroidales bacterium]